MGLILEIDLLKNYPRTERDPEQRGQAKTSSDQEIAREFGEDFFDGDRRHGYGGFYYNPRFWEPVIPTFQAHFGIRPSDSILDIGCAKGFMLYDLTRMIPGIRVRGLDISEYAISRSIPEIRPFLDLGSADSLPYRDDSFDFVFSITTLHNLPVNRLKMALNEIERVSRRGSFITVDAYRDQAGKERMAAWNLTAKTMLHVSEWEELFESVGFSGDYYWFIP